MNSNYLDGVEIGNLKKKGLELYVFTFGHGQEYEGKCQIIMAKGWMEARNLMFVHYKNKWGFQYSETEWRSILTPNNREIYYFTPETPLDYIIVESGHTWVKIRRGGVHDGEDE